MLGTLYVVATPIGNLSDITDRAKETFQNVDLVLAEDTRVTGALLAHLGFKKELVSYHQHSDLRKAKEIIGWLEEGKNIALVTDAGTPGISDPGNQLIETIIKSHPETVIVPVPGPSAVVAALSISGFPTDKFLFLGFPPQKNKRDKYFKEVAQSPHTVAFFESTHRIRKSLTELSAILDPKRRVVVCRELTKKFETTYRGTLQEILEQLIEERGEFVVVVSGI